MKPVIIRKWIATMHSVSSVIQTAASQKSNSANGFTDLNCLLYKYVDLDNERIHIVTVKVDGLTMQNWLQTF